MSMKIRTLVAALVVPFAFGAGAAHAYSGACSEALTIAAGQVTNEVNYVKSKNWTMNRDALMTKLSGVDYKLAENPPKTGDAMLIIGDMLQKIEAWSDPTLALNKRKLTDAGAAAIEATLTGEGGLTACITTNYSY